MAGQRVNYLSWDEFYMSIVSLASLRSTYSSSGVCLVDSDHRILSIGCSQAPYTVYDKIAGGLHHFILSPVANALFTFKGRRAEFEGGTIYLSDFPRPADARNLAQAKLQKLVYLQELEKNADREIAEKILDNAGIEMIPYIDDYARKEYAEFLLKFQTLLKKYLKKSDGPLSSEEYYMGIAVLSALRSKDPSTQVGACLVDENGRVLSMGYNGAPSGMSDDLLPWHSNGEITGDPLDVKDPYIIHAEMNVLDNYRGQQDDLSNMKLYLTLSPCDRCVERLSIVSPKEIVWLMPYAKLDWSFYGMWFTMTETTYHSYNSEISWDKDSYRAMFDETTKLIKKYIGKPGKMM